MAEQNGGELRRPVLAMGDGETTDVAIDPAPLEPSSDFTVRDLALHVLSGKELVATCSSIKPCHPERAVLISRGSGHDSLVLDYGWREEDLKAFPRVAILSDAAEAFPYEEVWSVENFDAFLDHLHPHEDDGRRVLGLACAQPLDRIAEVLARWLSEEGPGNIIWEAATDGFQGAVPIEITSEIEANYCNSYNLAPEEFADWLGAEGRRRWITAELKPNQFSDGAWHYPEYPDVTAFIELARTWFDTTLALPGLANELLALDELDCSQAIEITA